MISLLLDTGMRRAGLAGLEVEDVDLDRHEVSVLGKGRRRYTVSFGRKTAWALDRYLSERAKHRLSGAAESLAWREEPRTDHRLRRVPDE
jgi:integrase/recombinase XerC